MLTVFLTLSVSLLFILLTVDGTRAYKSLTSARVHLQIQAYESSTVDRKEMIHSLGL